MVMVEIVVKVTMIMVDADGYDNYGSDSSDGGDGFGEHDGCDHGYKDDGVDEDGDH